MGYCLMVLTLGCGEVDPTPEGLYETSTCSVLATVVGPEDFAVDEHTTGEPRLLVSSQDRRDPTQEGAIYSVSKNGSTSRLPLRGRGDCSFHPHGIFLVAQPKPKLYVINHHEARDGSVVGSCYPGPISVDGKATSVEVFEVRRRELRFLQRLANPEVLPHGNDLVADTEGNVYVTVPPSGAFGAVRDLMDVDVLPPTSRVVEFRCTKDIGGRCEGEWIEAMKVGHYINGIALRPDGSEPRLVVSSTLEGSPGILGLRREDEKWVEDGSWPFGRGHDNLLWIKDQTELLVASHPDLRRFLQHARSPRAASPSAVWKFSLEKGAKPMLILKDDGNRISGGSSAGCLGDQLVWGQVFGDTVMTCPLPEVCRNEEVDRQGEPS